MVITSPPSYVLAADFIASVTGPLASLLPVDPNGVQAILNGATRRVDSILGKSYLAREETRYYMGDGSNSLEIDETPLIYIRQIAFAQPGLGGLVIPTQNILIDYASGELITFMPLLLQGAGYVARFPRNVELAITAAWGAGYSVPPPRWIAADTSPQALQTLVPGTYQVAVTSRTFWGESTATPQDVTTETGAIQFTVTPVMGAERYRIYIGPAAASPADLMLAAEIPSTSFLSGPLGSIVTTTTLANAFPQSLPQVDTTPHEIPAGIIEATHLLARDLLLEDQNPANAGLVRDNLTQYATTGGTGKQSASPNWTRARELLEPFAYRDIL